MRKFFCLLDVKTLDFFFFFFLGGGEGDGLVPLFDILPKLFVNTRNYTDILRKRNPMAFSSFSY